jgi:hypothetical protein
VTNPITISKLHSLIQQYCIHELCMTDKRDAVKNVLLRLKCYPSRSKIISSYSGTTQLIPLVSVIPFIGIQ